MSTTLQSLALDLTSEFPRSPHETLGGYVIAGRTLDKCRAKLAGTLGEYHYDCPLDNYFFAFSGISAQEFAAQAESGADDAAMGSWINQQAGKSIDAIKLWNMQMRYLRPVDLPIQAQLFLEGYMLEVIPANRRVYTWFDVYDIEEKRI